MMASAHAGDGVNRGAITVCLILATLMQALDSTIANVALPYMQGSVAASQDEIEWVLTSYIAVAAIIECSATRRFAADAPAMSKAGAPVSGSLDGGALEAG